MNRSRHKVIKSGEVVWTENFLMRDGTATSQNPKKGIYYQEPIGIVKEENGYKSVTVTVGMKVENTSYESINARSLIETKLAYGWDYFQTRDGDFNMNELGD